MRFSATISSSQLARALKDIGEAEDSIKQKAKNAVNTTAIAVQNKAKVAAPVNLGTLRSQIHIKPVLGDDFSLWVEAEAAYSYFVEMGRGPGKPPPVDAIKKWARRKFGITGKELDSVAFLIARKIGKVGTVKHPFMFPAAESERRRHYERMLQALR